MTGAATDGWAQRVLVFGPPGAGVPLVVAGLQRSGREALGWEAGEDGHLAQDPANLAPGARPVLLALEASDSACLERAFPPWSERSLSSQAALAVRELGSTRERLFPARLRADLLVDSTHLTAQVLMARVRQLQDCLEADQPATPTVVVESFAYPRGVPLDLGWCVDARALRNPYWEPALRMLSGLDPRVQDFVLSQALAGKMLDSMEELVASLLPELQAHSRRTLRLAVGCTGGFHRSAAVAEELGRRLSRSNHSVLLWHRDLPERP